jgi:hypothetical protein
LLRREVEAIGEERYAGALDLFEPSATTSTAAPLGAGYGKGQQQGQKQTETAHGCEGKG